MRFCVGHFSNFSFSPGVAGNFGHSSPHCVNRRKYPPVMRSPALSSPIANPTVLSATPHPPQLESPLSPSRLRSRLHPLPGPMACKKSTPRRLRPILPVLLNIDRIYFLGAPAATDLSKSASSGACALFFEGAAEYIKFQPGGLGMNDETGSGNCADAASHIRGCKARQFQRKVRCSPGCTLELSPISLHQCCVSDDVGRCGSS